MGTQEVINVLREYNKWRKGKGRKYSEPGFPFDVKEIGKAIDAAIVHLSKRMDRNDFITMSAFAEEAVKTRKVNKMKMSDNEKKALRSMRKVVRFLVKNNG